MWAFGRCWKSALPESHRSRRLQGVHPQGRALPHDGIPAVCHLVEGMTRDSVLVIRPLGGSLSVNTSRAEVSGSGLSWGGAGCSPGVGVLCRRKTLLERRARRGPRRGGCVQASCRLAGLHGAALGAEPSPPTSHRRSWSWHHREASTTPQRPRAQDPPENPGGSGAITVLRVGPQPGGHTLSTETGPQCPWRPEQRDVVCAPATGELCLLTWATGSEAEALSLGCLPPGAHVFSGTSACEERESGGLGSEVPGRQAGMS